MPSIVQTQVAEASGASLTATLGATPTVGNILLAVSNSDSTLTIGGAWTQRFNFVSDQGFYIWDRVAGASEPTAITVTPSSSTYAALSVIEMAGVSGMDVVGTVVSSLNSQAATIQPSDIVATAAGDLTFSIGAMHGWSGTDPATPTFDNGFTTLTTAVTTGGSSAASGHFIGSKTAFTSGSIGATNIAWTNNTQNRAAVQIAYKASGGGSGTANFIGTVGAAVAAGIPGAFSATGSGGLFALRGGVWVPVTTYAAQGGSWV